MKDDNDHKNNDHHTITTTTKTTSTQVQNEENHRRRSFLNVCGKSSCSVLTMMLTTMMTKGDVCWGDVVGEIPSSAVLQEEESKDKNKKADTVVNSVSKDGEYITMYKTKSGLKYTEERIGTSGPTPRYGQFITIAYTSYIQLPPSPSKNGGSSQTKKEKPQEFDSYRGYLIKHGNGRTIAGLDEALHTMRLGSKRRLYIPPKLAYVQNGLGPIPSTPYGRYLFTQLLSKMIQRRGGDVIMDVEILNIMDDEADQGYYEDKTLSPEQFDLLRQNVQSSMKDAKKKQQQQDAAGQQQDDDDVSGIMVPSQQQQQSLPSSPPPMV